MSQEWPKGLYRLAKDFVSNGQLEDAAKAFDIDNKLAPENKDLQAARNALAQHNEI